MKNEIKDFICYAIQDWSGDEIAADFDTIAEAKTYINQHANDWNDWRVVLYTGINQVKVTRI